MKETKLYQKHLEEGAKFGEFGGYKMPLWYQSAKDEHLSVINRAGIFDTGHMSLIALSGNDAFSILNRTFTRELKSAKEGHALYGYFLRDDATLIDDAIIYVINKDSFYIVINAGMNTEILNHLKNQKYKDYIILDYTDQVGKIDIQGPNSLKIVQDVFGEKIFDDFSYFTFKGSLTQGDITFKDEPVIISRSGYTGEFGFEIFIDNNFTCDLWNELLKCGKEIGIIPCGLAARDSLRVGANLPLSHQDIGNWPINNTPWNFAISFNKVDFIGKSNLDLNSYTYAYTGFDVRKLRNPQDGLVYLKDKKIGRVLTCITEPSLGEKGLSAGFIWVNRKLEYGEILYLRDGQREIRINTVRELRSNKTARKSIKDIRSLM